MKQKEGISISDNMQKNTEIKKLAGDEMESVTGGQGGYVPNPMMVMLDMYYQTAMEQTEPAAKAEAIRVYNHTLEKMMRRGSIARDTGLSGTERMTDDPATLKRRSSGSSFSFRKLRIRINSTKIFEKISATTKKGLTNRFQSCNILHCPREPITPADTNREACFKLPFEFRACRKGRRNRQFSGVEIRGSKALFSSSRWERRLLTHADTRYS